MDDNARHHQSRAVRACLQENAITSVPWPAMSPDLNPLEHIWDLMGRNVHSMDPPVQNLRALEAVLHREWQNLTMRQIRQYTGGMRPRVEAVLKTKGRCTRY